MLVNTYEMIRPTYTLKLRYHPIHKRGTKKSSSSKTIDQILDYLYPPEISSFQKAQSMSSRLTEILHAEEEKASLLYGEIKTGGWPSLRKQLKERDPGFLKRCKIMVDVGAGRNRFLMEVFLHRSPYPNTCIGYEISPSRFQEGHEGMKLLPSYNVNYQLVSQSSPYIKKIQKDNKSLTLKHQNFLKDEGMVKTADLIFMNVELILDTMEDKKRVLEFLIRLKVQAILIAYDELHMQLPDFSAYYLKLVSIRIPTTWSPINGHPFYCYQRTPDNK